MPRKLPWPASKIEKDLLHELWLEAKATGLPITAVIQAAVNEHLNRRFDATAVQPPVVEAGSAAA